MNKRIQKLREETLSYIPRISMERAYIVDKTYKEYEGKVSKPVLRALVLKNLMSEKKLVINDDELIVGERGEAPGMTPTYPELCCHTVDDLKTMDQRKKVFFKVNKEDMKFQEDVIIPYWEERSIRSKIIKNVDQAWNDCYEAGIFTEFMEQRGPGHTVLDEKIYHKGFKDFKKDIEREIENLDFLNDLNALEKREELKAMSIACDAIMILGERYSKLALDMAQAEDDLKRKEELLKISEICSKVPKNKPETFYEAIQMYWFVHLCVISEINPWDAFSPGRLDQHLYPYYKKELEENKMTKEEAKELLMSFWVKFNNQPAPPKVGVTLKESGTYTDFANINIGGLKKDGSDGVNDVSFLLLDVIEKMRLLQPSTNVQISAKSPDKFIKRALKIIKTGFGQPSMFNTDAIIKEMLYAGKTLEDARCGGNSGCVETGAFGKEAYILTGYFNLPKILEITLNQGFDPVSKKQLGLKTKDPLKLNSYEELFDEFKKQLKHFIDIKVKGNLVIEKIYHDEMPVPFLSIIIDDCIKKGKNYNAGGARYNTSYIQGVGISNITDALSAIKYNVFDNKNFSFKELLDAMNDNFESHDRIMHLVKRKTPKYGNDDDYADAIMKDVFNSYYEEVTGRKNIKGGVHRINMLPTTCHVYFGSAIKAMPDGRLSYTPLADGISPAKGADINGPTAVIKSASKMDHLKTGGTLLNQKFTPSVVQGEEGTNSMLNLVRAYFKLDGHHIQFNVVDKETLLDAQKNPSEYENLIVRVAGFSDYFNNLDKNLQDEIILRTEQNI
ncbi:MAG: glycyl radical protein [Peptostreptococcaceae bacterium]|jgi:formate C-acetyltransferase|nr:glycyl radical protein [Peptostreptococcaceae bacterium]